MQSLKVIVVCLPRLGCSLSALRRSSVVLGSLSSELFHHLAVNCSFHRRHGEYSEYHSSRKSRLPGEAVCDLIADSCQSFSGERFETTEGEHFLEREIVVEVDDPDLGWIPTQNVVPKFTSTPRGHPQCGSKALRAYRLNLG